MSLKLMSAIIPISTQTQDRVDDSSKLLNQLLDCVQQCQKRYGGKTELATEFDSCVAGLCLTLEAVFQHGLRNKPQDSTQASTFKQVSDIVSSSFHLYNENPSFWPFVNEHLTKHERERYLVLKHIWTDIGRGKAWIRSALNERSLERYFLTVLSNKEILRTYYEDWALLCDDEKNSLLPNMAAGLGSILFAVSIDKPELNSGNLTQRIDKLKSKPEPIIEAPITEPEKPRGEQKRKYKVAKQLISFDEDENMLSSSVPSSSGSITSDSNSLQESQLKQSEQGNDIDKLKAESHTHNKEKSKRKLSAEMGGSRGKFLSQLVPDGPLTPIESNIGELTPVSIETNSESPDTSENLIEVPTDISAVLTAIESKNQEKIEKLEEVICGLNKENNSLKEQVKKYVSAVQMLKNSDGNLQKALEGLEVGNEQPDYKNEAKMFEKKLVQVADMHAELMDFNVLLQKSICQKDKLLERLKNELEELRGPMPTDESVEDSRGAVNIWIPSAFLTGSGSDTHHVYQIYLRAGCDEWNIYRRYAQFYALHTDLKKLDPAIATFDFPPKKSIGKKDATLVEDRRKRLQIYLRKILAHWPELSQCNSRFLLEQQLTFFKDAKESDKNKRENRCAVFPSRRSAGSESHYTGL